MFGVMKNRSCSQTDEQKLEYRMHYCGTCKTMGSMFGQASRFLLNNDAVFLSEILTGISTSSPGEVTWAKQYRSFNCMSLPSKDTDEMPLPLQISASVILLLTEFKIADHIIDSKREHWNSARKFFSKEFEIAATKLEFFNFPLKDLWHLFETQQDYEFSAKLSKQSHDPVHLVDYCAKPTARMTEIVFESGARAVGQHDESVLTEMRIVGNAFGKLVYVLDAFEDFSRDLRRGEFNPIAIAFDSKATESPILQRTDSALSRKTEITLSQKEQLFPYIAGLAHKIEHAINALPLTQDQASLFRNRLRQNVADKLGSDWREFASSKCQVHSSDCSSQLRAVSAHVCSNARMTIVQRRDSAYSIADDASKNAASYTKQLLKFCLFVIAFAFPYHAKQARDSFELLGIPFNLMAWGAFVNDLFKFPTKRPSLAFAMSGTSGGGSDDELPKKRQWGERHGGDFKGDQPEEPLPELVEKPPVDSASDYQNDSSGAGKGDPNYQQQPTFYDPDNPNDPNNPGKEPDRQRQNQVRGKNFKQRDPQYRAYGSDPFCMPCCVNCGCNSCCELTECACDTCYCINCFGSSADCCGGIECCAGGDACAGADCCGGMDCAGADCAGCDCAGADCGGC